ncbi:MAG: hypothetical protein QXI59_01595 [Candidatus Bathyarchaeia archaeon]
MKIVNIDARISIVEKIRDGDLKYALELLSRLYDVPPPSFRVGTVKGHRKSTACYIASQKTILFSNSEALLDPRIVLHEFYHHLTYHKTLKDGGTDKDADRFVRQFLLTP